MPILIEFTQKDDSNISGFSIIIFTSQLSSFVVSDPATRPIKSRTSDPEKGLTFYAP